jgi:hypothetical protein
MSDDPRMQMTLRDVEKYLITPRHHALTIWKFPVLYPRSEACKNSTSAAATKTAPPPCE